MPSHESIANDRVSPVLQIVQRETSTGQLVWSCRNSVGRIGPDFLLRRQAEEFLTGLQPVTAS